MKINQHVTRLLGSSSLLLGAFALGLPAAAQVADSSEVEQENQSEVEQEDQTARLSTVVVQAQRRDQDLQDVPFAVAAFGEDQIEKSDVDEILSLETLVPGLRVSGDEKMNIVLRGVGTDIQTALSEAAVPVNIDGVYMSRTSIGSSVFADLASIEVLKGPQGTLYGRNATGGTVNMWTKEPDGEFGGKASVLVGNGGRVRIRGAAGIPLNGDKLSARVAFASDQVDGYRKNLATGNDVEGRDHVSFQGALKWAPTDNFEAILRFSQSENDNSSPVTVFGEVLLPFNPFDIAGGVGADDPRNVRNDLEPRLQTTNDVYSATLSWDLGGVVFKSVSALQEHTVDRLQDSEGSDIFWTNTNFVDESEAFTQEFTLTSDGDGPVDWVAGVWYYDDDLQANMEFFLNPAFFSFGPAGPLSSFGLDMNQQTEAYAGFAQATWNITDRLRLTGGVRYSEEEKSFTQSRVFRLDSGAVIPICQDFSFDDSWSNTTPKIAVDYDLSEDVLLYGSIARGFKAGGANMSECNNRFDEETLTAYEAGFKSELFNNTVRLNINGFYYEYEDYQINRIILNSAAIENAPGAEIIGIEAELFAQPIEGLTINSGLSIQETEILDLNSTNTFTGAVVDLTGNQLPNAPEMSWNIGAQYEMPVGNGGRLTFRGEHSWTDDFFFDQFNESWSLQESYGVTNLRVIYGRESGAFEGVEVHAFVNNLEDEDILRRVAPISLLGGTVYNFQEPQTYGVEIIYSF